MRGSTVDIQSLTTEVSPGKKEEEEERRHKSQGKNIRSAPIT